MAKKKKADLPDIPQIRWVEISHVKENEENPRKIRKVMFQKLKNSMTERPEFYPLMPLKVDDDGIILGGNMRFKASLELGHEYVPIQNIGHLDPEARKEFLIKDNAKYGEYDWPLVEEYGYSYELMDYWGELVPMQKKIGSMKDGDEIELEQSVQLEPPQEYLIIVAPPNSLEWEQLKEDLKLKMVRRGGYKKGSAFDATGLERVIPLKEFRKRYVDSSTK